MKQRRVFMRAILAVILTCFCLSPAQASVIFNWEALTGEGNASGFIRVTDEAYASGQIDWSFDNISDPLPPPEGPVEEFQMWYFGDCKGCMSKNVLIMIGTFDFHLTVLDSGLTGSIYSNNTGNHISMGGGLDSTYGTLWTITAAATDGNPPCNQSQNDCYGDTGRWVLAAPPAAVPEPLSLFLMGFGLVALLCVQRRHTRRI